MRLEEILTLTWDRVDVERGRVYLPGHLTKTGARNALYRLPLLCDGNLQRLRVPGWHYAHPGACVYQGDGQKHESHVPRVQRLCEEQGIEDLYFMTSATAPLPTSRIQGSIPKRS